jgi:hypothetical protein
MNFVAPGLADDQYDESKSLDVFQSRTTDWILAFSITVSRQNDGGISALIIATSVIEPMGGILTGSSSVENRFRDGFNYLFPEVGGASKDVYNRLRGGLFHEGFIKTGLVITDLSRPIEVKNGFVYIDPRRFAVAVYEGFRRFCGDIRADPTLKRNFDTYWNRQVEVNMKPFANVLIQHPGTPTTLSTSAAMPVPDPRFVSIDEKYKAK